MAIPHKTLSDTTTSFAAKPISMAATNVSKLIYNNAKTLYSDPIAAVIREIVTNAKDASENVTVTMPTHKDPQFVVSDQGEGMSTVQVEGDGETPGLYVTIGASTKTNSNTQTGEKGIGRFSFLAYGNNATIITQGRVYSFHMDERDEVCLTPVGMSKDYPTGTTVIVPVRPNDIYNFETKAKTILKYFPDSFWPASFGPKPKAIKKIGNLEVWGGGYYGSGLKVSQGCVAYPVSRDFLNEHFSDSEFATLRTVMSNDMTITVPIGTLSTTASREALNYDPTTTKNLIAEITKAYTTLEAHYSSMPQTWDACYEAFAAMRSSTQRMDNIALPFLGKKFRNLNPLTAPDLENVEVRVCPSDIQLQWRADDKIPNLPLGNHVGDKRSMYIDKTYAAPEVYVQFESDKITNARSRIAYDQRDSSDARDTLVWIKARHPKCPHFKALIERMYNPEYTSVATLTSPPKQSRVRAAGNAPFKLIRKDTRWGHDNPRTLYSNSPGGEPRTEGQPNLYIITDAGSTDLNTDTAQRISRNHNMGDIYLVPRTRVDEVSDNPMWIEFTAWLTAYYEANANPQEEHYSRIYTNYVESAVVYNLNRVEFDHLTEVRKPVIVQIESSKVQDARQFLNIETDEIDTTEAEALTKKLDHLNFWFPMLAVNQHSVTPDAMHDYACLVSRQMG